MARLTPEIQANLVAFLRAGGFPEVAAEASGITAAQFSRWMQRGSQPGAPRRLREFVTAVMQAVAQARLGAEVAMHENKPLEWLKFGPGRIDWGAKAKPHEQAPGLEHPVFRTLLVGLLAALEPYPEARQAAAEILDASCS
ncbi:MAG: hypothetical protein EBV06_04715 [Planctomycetia bacterium]|nr:hypothetical protein [Planctomycetia bacterium]